MKKRNETNGIKIKDEDLGYILWQLESLEKFFPCYRKMIKKER